MAADQYINATGLAVIKAWIEGKFALDSDLDALDARVDGIVSQGGEPNVIETVKVNGTPLVPDAQKAVDVEAAQMEASRNNGELQGVHIAQGENELRVFKSGRVVIKDDAETVGVDLATIGYVDENGGKIDKIQVNGTDQPITSKTVDITVPTNNNQLTNGAGYQTATDVSGLIDTALANGSDPYTTTSDAQDLIDAALADITGIDFQVVATLPASGVKGTIYLVANSGSNPNIYDEYIWLDGDPSGSFEKIGTTEVDLSAYWTSTAGQSNSLTAMTVAEINAILEPATP